MSLPPMLSNFPTPPSSVTVIFRGLLTFCFDGGNACEVGVVHESAFEPGQEHDLLFRKWIKSPNCPTEPDLVYSKQSKPVNDFKLQVNNPLPSVSGVHIIGQGEPFNRLAPGNHPNDFRWMIDFESELYDSHPTPITKRPSTVKPRLTMEHGVFYTHQKTLTKFNAVLATGAGAVKLGGASIAEVMAAQIYLDVGGSVDVIIDGNKVDTLPQIAGTTYQIDVFNLCNPTAHADCVYLPAHPTNKRKRNDFFTYYHTLSLSGSLEEYHLMAVLPIPGQPNPVVGICRGPNEDGSDPAPCGPGGFGKSQTFG